MGPRTFLKPNDMDPSWRQMGGENIRHIAEEPIRVLPQLYGVSDPWYPIRHERRSGHIDATDKFVHPVESDEDKGERKRGLGHQADRSRSRWDVGDKVFHRHGAKPV